MKRRRHNQKTAVTTGGHATVATLPKGKVRCDICYGVCSTTKAGVRRKHKLASGTECPGSGMRA